MECDVAIVGYGPVGALLANLLGSRGVRTVVIERDREVYRLPRAVHFDAEVMRIFQSVGLAEEALKLYAGDRDMKDPFLSPVYGNLSGFPPTVLISGTRDLLLSNTVRAHRKLRAAGVTAELHVYEAQSHSTFLISFPAPESQDALREIAEFFARHLGRP